MPLLQRLGTANTLTALLERTLRWGPTLLGATGTSGVSAWAAYASAWLDKYGPIAWVAAALLGLLVFSGIYALWAYARLSLANAAAMRKWEDTAESINPLDSEFTRKRINPNELRNPITGRVAGKKFISCEFIGPANLLFLRNNYVNVDVVSECDFVVTRQADFRVFNAVIFEDAHFVGGSMWRCTIFIPPTEVPTFRKAGAKFVTLTGTPEIDTQSQM